MLCGIFNALGVVLGQLLGGRVSQTVFSLVRLDNPLQEKIAIVSTLGVVIIFGIGAWALGMPSSESHAMLCALVGAGFYFGSGLTLDSLVWIFACMAFSSLLVLLLAFFLSRVLRAIHLPHKSVMLICLCLLSLLHGWQDGAKFIGIFDFLSPKSNTPSSILGISSPILIVGVFLFVGSFLCSKRIVSSYESSVILSKSESCYADFATSCVLFLCSLLGFPISTGVVKIFGSLGVGIKKKGAINKKIATSVVITSVATFPICFFLGYLLALVISYVL